MTKNIFLLAGISLLFWTSCDNLDLEIPTLNISVDTQNAVMIDENNIPVFRKGENVKFNIDAQADMITFYSGEPGMMYKHRNRTSIDGSPYMQFDVELEGSGMPNGSLRVLLSSDFKGFTKDSDIDAQRIQGATWIDISDQCNIPIIPNTTNSTPKIDLGEYAGKPLYVAFRCVRPKNSGEWPRYQVKNLAINNEADGTSYSVMNTGNAGWIVYDFNAPEGTDPYLSNGGAASNRVWDIRNAVTDNRIYIGYSSSVAYDDWAVTAAIDLTSVSPDLGEGIKAYDDDRIRDYQYVYNTKGVFTVTFVAFKSRFSEKEMVVKELTIKVID